MALFRTRLTWACMLVLSIVVTSSPIPQDLSGLKDITSTVDAPTPIHPNIENTPHIGIPESSIRHPPLSKPKEVLPRDDGLQGADLVSALLAGGILNKALGTVAPQ